MNEEKINKKLDSICANMKDAGFTTDLTQYELGSDFCTFNGIWYNMPLTILINPNTNQFFIYSNTSDTELASHKSPIGDIWYTELVKLILVS